MLFQAHSCQNRTDGRFGQVTESLVWLVNPLVQPQAKKYVLKKNKFG